MAESLESNGRARPLSDVTGDGFVPTGDEDKLITDPGAIDSPGSAGSAGPKSEMSPLQMEAHDGQQGKQALSQGLKIIIVSSISFGLSVTVALVLTIFLAPPPIAPHGAVVSDVDECSVIGTDMLKKGGSAVDAAIATLFCIGVVNCHHSGIGGGGFMVVREQRKNLTTVFDFREMAPANASDDMFSGDLQKSLVGGLSVGVPGELKGMKAAYDQFGKLTWRDLVMPAVNLSRNGFKVTDSLAYAIGQLSPEESIPLTDMLLPGGKPLVAGDLLKRPDLATTLETIANDGIEPFYSGDIAQDIIDTVNNAGGIFQKIDLSGYTAVAPEPVSGRFLNTSVETVPAPGGGPLLIFLLHVLENYTLSSQNFTLIKDKQDYMFYHRLIEAIKFSQAERYRFGDPAAVSDMDAATATVTSMDYAALIRSRIDETQTMPADYYLKEGGVADDTGTSHVSVIGSSEDYVSVTSSINRLFGSQLMTPSGIILNDHMGDFSFDDLTSDIPVNMNNKIAPNKRPMSSMTPTVVYAIDKPCGVRMSLGAINGSRIISGIAQVLINFVAFHQSLEDSIVAMRLYDPLLPYDVIEYDTQLDKDLRDFLRGMGHHNFTHDDRGVNFVNAAAKVNETIRAFADSRQTGSGASIF